MTLFLSKDIEELLKHHCASAKGGSFFGPAGSFPPTKTGREPVGYVRCLLFFYIHTQIKDVEVSRVTSFELVEWRMAIFQVDFRLADKPYSAMFLCPKIKWRRCWIDGGS